jgi:hypothetical protein
MGFEKRKSFVPTGAQKPEYQALVSRFIDYGLEVRLVSLNIE